MPAPPNTTSAGVARLRPDRGYLLEVALVLRPYRKVISNRKERRERKDGFPFL